MARRPTTKLSRKLFSKAPEIKPLPTGNVPSFALGKEQSITPLRSDIAGIRVKEGEDFLTFDLFKNAVREGRINVSKYNAYGRKDEPTKNPTLDDYYGWRREFMDRNARRDRRADTRFVKIGRVDDPKLLRERNLKIDEDGDLVSSKEIETENEYLAEGATPLFRGGRNRYTIGGAYWRYDETGLNRLDGGSYYEGRYDKLEKENEKTLFERKLVDTRDVNVDMPLAPYETRGMTPKQKEEFFAKERAKVKDEVKEGVYVKKPIYYSDGRLARYDRVKEEDAEKLLPFLPFSLTDEFRKKKASALAESREGMSRAQQRKLGRVIRDGKTGPQTRTRKTPFTEDEYRNVYDVVEYEPKRYDFEDREATLEYTYGYNKGKGDLVGQRSKLRTDYNEDNERLKQLDEEYKGLRDEKKRILSKYKGDVRGLSDTDKRYMSFMGISSKDRLYYGDRTSDYKQSIKKLSDTELAEPTDVYDYNDSEYRIGRVDARAKSAFDDDLVKMPKQFSPLLTPEERKEILRTERNIGKVKKEVLGILEKKSKLRDQFDDIRIDRLPEQVVQKKKVVVRNKKELNEAIAEMKRLTADSGLARDINKDFLSTRKEDTHLTDYNGRRKKMDEPISDDKTLYTLRNAQHDLVSNMKDADYITKRDKRYKFYGLDDDLQSKPLGRVRHTGWGMPPPSSSIKLYEMNLDNRYAENDAERFNLGLDEGKKYAKNVGGKNPILDLSEDEANTFLRREGMLTGSKFEDRKYPETNFSHNGVKMNKSFKDDFGIRGFKEVPMDSEGGFLALAEVGKTEEVMSKGMRYNKDTEDKLFVGKDGKLKARKYGGKRQRPIKKVRVVREPKRDIFGNSDFVMRVGRGKGRRVFHTEEAGRKGWKQTGINKYTKQADSWKSLDVDTTPKEELQLRGLRDRRTARGRLLGRGRLDPRRVDRSKEYKSARQEAIIQMRINETAGVRDAKSKADKEIKNIRISEAQKALNLKLAKETAEKTTEGLKAKNAGLVHSYNVNVRNATAATLLGSDPIELNKILKQGGGLALIKTMIRKGEIVDASTIGQLNTSSKQKENLLRLLNEGGDFVEGQEYFFRDLDDFGRTAVRRGYLNKGGERKKNLELMKITTNADGTSTTERFIVPKSQIVKPDDYTTTTSSGRKQGKVPKTITDFELDLFAAEAPTPKPVGEIISVDPKTGAKSLVKSKGAGIADPSPKPQSSILSTLQNEGDFDTMGGDLNLTLAPASDDSATSEEGFEFGGDAPIEPEPDTSTPYGIKPKSQPTIDEELDLLGGGEADEIAEVLGGDIPQTYQQTLDEAEGELSFEEKEFNEMEKFLEEQEKIAKAEAEAKAPEPEPEVKKVSISDEVKEMFGDDTKTASVVPNSWRGESDNVPDTLLKDSWDMRGRGLKSRLADDGIQNVPEGYIAIWTTKWAPKDNQTALVVNEADIYYLMRGLKGVKVRNDKGKLNTITDSKLKSLYRKVIEGIREGKKQTAFNDQQLLRALDMIEPYKEEESEEESEDED